MEDSLIVYFRFLQSNPDVLRLPNWMVIEGDSKCASLSEALSYAGVDTLRRAQQEGSMRSDVEPEYVLAEFLALVRGWFQRARHHAAWRTRTACPTAPATSATCVPR